MSSWWQMRGTAINDSFVVSASRARIKACCCQGKLTLPSPKINFWAASANLSLIVYDPPGNTTPFEDRPYFFDCGSTDICLEDFQCAPGYTGKLCKDCKPNQFYWGGRCDYSCSAIGPPWPVTILAMSAVVLVWTALQTVKSDVLCLLLNYMQIMAVGFNFKTRFAHSDHWNTIAFIFRARLFVLPAPEWSCRYDYATVLFLRWDLLWRHC